MTSDDPEPPPDEDARDRLTTDTRARRLRRFWRMVPGSPRCKLCTSPFGAPLGPVLRLVGKGPWPGNPRYCGGCFKELYAHRSGAEVEATFFFADVRNSTQLAESMAAGAYRTLLDRVYGAATDVLVHHEAVVDKFVGDEVVGIFIPAFAGSEHARQAIDAGVALLRTTGNDGPEPWIPIGIGVNTGTAWVGAVGTADHVEFTALGAAVNVTARLASAAASGELLVTDDAARSGGVSVDGLERRRLDLRGKASSTDVVVMRAGEGDQIAAR